jgi:hypothetical protein
MAYQLHPIKAADALADPLQATTDTVFIGDDGNPIDVGVKQLANMAAIATDADAAAIVTAVNALLADMKAKNIMVGD